MTENIEVFTQNSIRIDIGKILYFDPFQHKKEINDADYIFITHDHYDHFSPDDIKKVVKEDTVFIVPQKLEKQVKDILPEKGDMVVMAPGDSLEMEGFSISLLKLDDELKELLDAPAETPALKV